MPLIPYPSVPNYPGVPAIPRTAPGVPSIDISIGVGPELVSVSQLEPQWGIYTQDENLIYTPTDGGTLSVLSFGFERSMQVSDFPIEANNTNQGAAFASFNKVFIPSNPVLTLALSGTELEKTAFLTAIDTACQSTDLYNVYTPDAEYSSRVNGACTIERYSYQRTATHGATMLNVEVSLKQVLQVTAALTNVPAGTTGITSPQSPSATSATNGGTVNGNDTPVLSQDSIDAILGLGAR